LAEVLQKASDEVEMTYPEPPEFVAQGDRVLVVGVATGKIKATNKAFKDERTNIHRAGKGSSVSGGGAAPICRGANADRGTLRVRGAT
jgi:hypothetical protein